MAYVYHWRVEGYVSNTYVWVGRNVCERPSPSRHWNMNFTPGIRKVPVTLTWILALMKLSVCQSALLDWDHI